jgi:hypothetical protein
MDDFMGSFVMPLVAVLAVTLAAGLVAAIVMEPRSCLQRWERSGARAEWQFGPGCLVQLKDGSWVPERAVKGLRP